jgi:hypothetical protein
MTALQIGIYVLIAWFGGLGTGCLLLLAAIGFIDLRQHHRDRQILAGHQDAINALLTRKQGSHTR